MDSMIKNLGGDFLQEMTKDIVGVFCHAFESLNDPKVRISLYKLRQTWPQYIPLRKLAAIDRHIHAIDPNWPVTAHEPSSPTIFLNPKFLGSQEKESDKSKDSKENIGYVAARKSPIIEVESDGVTTISKTSESHKDKNSHNRLVPPVRRNHSQSPPAMRIPKKGSPSPIKRENRSRSRSPKIDPSTKAKSKEDKTSVAGAVNPKGQLARSRSSRSPLQNSLSVHDKRKKVLEEQRQKKLDTQRAIGLLPLPQDDTDLSQVMQKHHRNVPDTGNDKSVKIENEEDIVEKDDPEMEEHVNKVAGLKRRSDEIAENVCYN
jgi:pre-mRNA cleavage complex 2 protein Pcf11